MTPAFMRLLPLLPVRLPFLVSSRAYDYFHNKSEPSTGSLSKPVPAGILLAIVWMMGAMSADAAVWYVNRSATGANIGADWNNAWADFSKIDWSSVSPGDTIYVAGGSYGYFTVGASGTASSPITIKRVRASDAIAVLAAGWDSAFDSQVVQTVPKGQSGIYINQGIGSFLTVDGRVNAGCRFNKLDDIQVEGLFFNDPDNSNVLIYGNLFYQGSVPPNTGRGIQFTGTGNSGILVYNNTFVGLPIGIELGDPGTYSGCAFRNNIVYGCTLTLGSGWVSDHNLIGNSPDPFVNSAAFDYHLAPNSPAIHAGLNLGTLFNLVGTLLNVDMDGVPRLGWSIGAYEYASGATPT